MHALLEVDEWALGSSMPPLTAVHLLPALSMLYQGTGALIGGNQSIPRGLKGNLSKLAWLSSRNLSSINLNSLASSVPWPHLEVFQQ